MTLRSATRTTPPPSYTYSALIAKTSSPPSKKRSSSPPAVKTEWDPPTTPMPKWGRNRLSDFPAPYRYASTRCSPNLPAPRPRKKRVISMPEDLRLSVSQVHTKLGQLGVPPADSRLVSFVLPVLLGRLYDRDNLWDMLNLEAECWLECLRSTVLQVLSTPQIDLARSWPTAHARLRSQVPQNPPGTALLAGLNHAWNERDFRYQIIDVLSQACPGQAPPSLTAAGEFVYEVDGLQRALIRALWP